MEPFEQVERNENNGHRWMDFGASDFESSRMSLYNWQRSLRYFTMYYILFSIFYYATLMISFSKGSISVYLLSIIITSVILSLLCIIVTYIWSFKSDPSTYTTLIEYWVALTLLLLVFLILCTKKSIDIRSRNLESFTTYDLLFFHSAQEQNHYFNTQNQAQFHLSRRLNGTTEYEESLKSSDKDDKDDTSSSYESQKSSDKDDIDNDKDKDDIDNDKDDSSKDFHNKLIRIQQIRKIIKISAFLGSLTLITQCLGLFILSKIQSILYKLYNLDRDSQIELQVIASK